MQHIVSNDRVRLVNELSELQLRQGEVGIVRSSWHIPTIAYEVEFETFRAPVRVLLLDYQVASDKSD